MQVHCLGEIGRSASASAPSDGRSCAFGCVALSPSLRAQRACQIRLGRSTFSSRHAPHSRQPRQPAGSPHGPLGRTATANPDVTPACGAADPPAATGGALKEQAASPAPQRPPTSCRRRAAMAFFWARCTAMALMPNLSPAARSERPSSKVSRNAVAGQRAAARPAAPRPAPRHHCLRPARLRAPPTDRAGSARHQPGHRGWCGRAGRCPSHAPGGRCAPSGHDRGGGAAGPERRSAN